MLSEHQQLAEDTKCITSDYPKLQYCPFQKPDGFPLDLTAQFDAVQIILDDLGFFKKSINII